MTLKSTLENVSLTSTTSIEKTFEEIMAENFLNMGKKIVKQVQEAQRVPGRIKPRRNTPRLIVIKFKKKKKS